MAARSQQNASDNFVEQLLRSGPEVSGYDGTEAEAEEVDYDETDEDLQDVQGPSQSDRGRDTNRSPAKRGKHNPISWRDWQRPDQAGRLSRGREQRSPREPQSAQGKPDRRREHADREGRRAERARPLPAARREDEAAHRRVRPERERGHMPEDAYYGRPGLHDRHWEDNREHWEPARYRHPGNFHLLDERPSPYAEHRRSLEAHMHARSPPPPRSHPRMDPFAPHLRERSPPHAHAGGPWPPFPHDYLDDRPSPQRSVLVQRAGPEAERLVIRRPLSPEHHSPPESWYRVHPADRRVEYSPRPLPVYGPIAHHGPPRELLHEGGPHWHPSPERGLHRDSVLRAARGAVSPRPHEHKEPARAPAPRQLPDCKGHHLEHSKAGLTARDPDRRHVPAPEPQQLPGPPLLPGPPPVLSQEARNGNERRQKRSTLFSDGPPAADTQQAPRAEHRSSEQVRRQPERQLADSRPAGAPHSDAHPAEHNARSSRARQNVELNGRDHGSGSKHSHAADEVPKPGRPTTAESIAAAERAGNSLEASHGKRAADDSPEHGERAHSKRSSCDRAADASAAQQPKKADKAEAKAESTFVRDFYARSDRQAPQKAAEAKERRPPRGARGAERDAQQTANDIARSAERDRDAPSAVPGRRDALRELRERGGPKALRSVKDSERRRGSPRHRSASPRNGKAGRRAGLPSWLSGKPEDANEWFYTDPKGKLQGPCSIASFRLWLARMKENPQLDGERQDFLRCMVWRKGMNRREPLERLLALADAEAAKKGAS